MYLGKKKHNQHIFFKQKNHGICLVKIKYTRRYMKKQEKKTLSLQHQQCKKHENFSQKLTSGLIHHRRPPPHHGRGVRVGVEGGEEGVPFKIKHLLIAKQYNTRLQT